VYPIVVYAIFFDRKARKKSPETYRRERAYRHAERASAQYTALPVVVHEAREIRRAPVRKPQAAVKVEVPSFLVDVQSALINLQYKKKEAVEATQRATGDDFATRLKNALNLLRLPDAKLTA